MERGGKSWPEGAAAPARGRPADSKPNAKPNTKSRLSSVANAIRLVKAFSEDEYEIGISNLARRLGLGKSTVHRLASTLIAADFLEKNPETGAYRLGLALFELGTLVRRKMNVANEARPQLKALMEKTGETVHLAVLDHASVLFINTIASRQAIRMSSTVGSRVPSHCSSEGKVLLAFRPNDVIEGVIAAGLPAWTPKTIVDPKQLREELAQVRQRGYSIDDEEIEVGLRSVAAPIRNHRGDVVASISIAGPVQRVSKKVLQSYVPDVVAAANAISQRLGFVPGRVPTLAG
jgi:IclR family transcriptional regulator, KDG regulon repressor